MHTIVARGHARSSTAAFTTSDLRFAEARHRDAANALADARTKLGAARAAERIVVDAKTAADASVAAARAEVERAEANVAELEAAWSRDQSDANWARVAGARSARDQASLIESRAEASAVLVGVTSTPRATASPTRPPSSSKPRAHPGGRGWSSRATSRRPARSELEARQRGEQLQCDAELAVKMKTFAADVEAELAPPLADYLRAVELLRKAEAEVDRALQPLRARGRKLVREAGFTKGVPTHLDLRVEAPTLVSVAAGRVFGPDPWGLAPKGHSPRPSMREGRVGDRNAMVDTIDAAVRAHKARAEG